MLALTNLFKCLEEKVIQEVTGNVEVKTKLKKDNVCQEIFNHLMLTAKNSFPGTVAFVMTAHNYYPEIVAFEQHLSSHGDNIEFIQNLKKCIIQFAEEKKMLDLTNVFKCLNVTKTVIENVIIKFFDNEELVN